MQLSVLLDALVDHEVDEDASRSEIPCRVQDAELWFAELPATSSRPRRCAGSARSVRPAWREPASGASRGACGAASCSSRASSCPRKRPRGRPRKSEVAA